MGIVQVIVLAGVFASLAGCFIYSIVLEKK